MLAELFVIGGGGKGDNNNMKNFILICWYVKILVYVFLMYICVTVRSKISRSNIWKSMAKNRKKKLPGSHVIELLCKCN